MCNPPLPVTLMSRPGCGACEEMAYELQRRYRERVLLAIVEVDGDSVLRRRWGLRVPVLLDADGGVICERALDGAAIDEALAEHQRRFQARGGGHESLILRDR